MDARDNPAFLLHDVARRARYIFDARARDVGATRQQWRVLLYLARHQGPSQSELADFLEVERITLCRMIDRLGDAGLVERRADPNDRRIWRLYLTERAHGIVERLGAIGTALEAELLAPLDPAEQALLRNFLIRIRDGISRRYGETGGKAA